MSEETISEAEIRELLRRGGYTETQIDEELEKAAKRRASWDQNRRERYHESTFRGRTPIDDEPRAARITIQVTDTDRKNARTAASAAGLSLTQWILNHLRAQAELERLTSHDERRAWYEAAFRSGRTYAEWLVEAARTFHEEGAPPAPVAPPPETSTPSSPFAGLAEAKPPTRDSEEAPERWWQGVANGPPDDDPSV